MQTTLMNVFEKVSRNLEQAKDYATRSRAGLIASLQQQDARVQDAMNTWGRDAEKWEHISTMWDDIASRIDANASDNANVARRVLLDQLDILRGRLHWNAENPNPRNQLQVSALCKVIEDIQRI